MTSNFPGLKPEKANVNYEYLESSYDPRMFSEHSYVKRSILNSNINNTQSQITKLSSELSQITTAKDKYGNEVINLTPEREWFQNNVMILICRGAVYDEYDEKTLNDILSAFDETSTTHLTCEWRCMDYSEELVKAAEHELIISNGDYHLLVVPIVITKNVDILEQAPEDQYKQFGFVNKYINIDDIHTYFREIIINYAFVYKKQYAREPTSRDMGIIDNHVQISKEFDGNTMFSIDGELDPISQKHVDDHFEALNRGEESLGMRQRKTEYQRENGYSRNLHKDRIAKGGTLMSRIYNDTNCPLVDTTVPSDKAGVILRYHERIPPPESTEPEYQLFDDNSTYSNGKNDMETAALGKQALPSFQSINRRGRTARTSAINKYAAIMNSTRNYAPGVHNANMFKYGVN